MDKLTVQKQVNILWAKGYNPIHLFKNLYLVRYEPTYCSKIPFYVIKKITEQPLDKMKNI